MAKASAAKRARVDPPLTGPTTTRRKRMHSEPGERAPPSKAASGASPASPSEDSPASSGHDPAGPSPLERLPSELLSHILSFLSVGEALRARATCRAFRDCLEATVFLDPALSVRARSADVLDRLTRLVGGGGLQLRGDVRLRVSGPFKSLRAQPAALLRALAEGPLRRLREAEVRFSLADGAKLARHVSDVLGAVRPAGAALEALLVASDADAQHGSLAACDPQQLHASLAPLANLRHLHLPPSFVVEPPHAAAVAAACPLLRRLALRPCGVHSPNGVVPALAALASLAHLEELELFGRDNPHGIDDVARGPAGQSLRVIRLSSEPNANVVFGAASFLAMAAMPRLEAVEGWIELGGNVGPETLSELQALSRLRSLHLSFRLCSLSVVALSGLAAALTAGCPALTELGIRGFVRDSAPSTPGYGAAASEALAALYIAGRRALREVSVDSHAPLSEAEAAALAACGPQLARVHLQHRLAGGEDLAAYRALGGLRLASGARSLSVRIGAIHAAARALRCTESAVERALREMLPDASVEFFWG
eukprot:tig00020960_g16557.t1